MKARSIYHKRRVDANQKAIVQALKAMGASVTDLHSVGRGCPDLLVGYRGGIILLEVKSSEKARFTKAEEEWSRTWRGEHCYAVWDTLGACLIVQSIALPSFKPGTVWSAAVPVRETK